jgi:hypothetical protein
MLLFFFCSGAGQALGAYVVTCLGLSRKDMIFERKRRRFFWPPAQNFPQQLGVDFCTQCEYPPLQLRGGRARCALFIYASQAPFCCAF